MPVFHPGEFCVALLSKKAAAQELLCELSAAAVPGRNSLAEDQAMGTHLTTQRPPKEQTQQALG